MEQGRGVCLAKDVAAARPQRLGPRAPWGALTGLHPLCRSTQALPGGTTGSTGCDPGQVAARNHTGPRGRPCRNGGQSLTLNQLGKGQTRRQASGLAAPTVRIEDTARFPWIRRVVGRQVLPGRSIHETYLPPIDAEGPANIDHFLGTGAGNDRRGRTWTREGPLARRRSGPAVRKEKNSGWRIGSQRDDRGGGFRRRWFGLTPRAATPRKEKQGRASPPACTDRLVDKVTSKDARVVLGRPCCGSGDGVRDDPSVVHLPR